MRSKGSKLIEYYEDKWQKNLSKSIFNFEINDILKVIDKDTKLGLHFDSSWNDVHTIESVLEIMPKHIQIITNAQSRHVRKFLDTESHKINHSLKITHTHHNATNTDWLLSLFMFVQQCSAIIVFDNRYTKMSHIICSLAHSLHTNFSILK